MNENLFEIFRQSFPADLSRTFLERPDGSRLSYGDVIELSGRVARVLQDLGVAPGDRVAAQTEKSAEALLLYLGTLRAGGVYLISGGLGDMGLALAAGLATPGGLEPPTNSLEGCCSNPLSYGASGAGSFGVNA